MPNRDEFKRLEYTVTRIAASTFYKGERATVLQFVVEKKGSFDPGAAGHGGPRVSGNLPKKDVL